jgi:hypothetical protein
MSGVRVAVRAVLFRLGVSVSVALNAAVPVATAGEVPRSLLPTTNVSVTQSSVCHRVDEVNAALFPQQRIIGYDFAGTDARNISQAIRALDDEGAPEAATVRVVLVLATYETIAFQFGADGCHVMTIRLEFDEMMQVFERAGVTPPFGPTYSKIDRAL